MIISFPLSQHSLCVFLNEYQILNVHASHVHIVFDELKKKMKNERKKLLM